MADLGQAYTDKKIENLAHRISGIYKEANKDINRKMKEFNEKYKVKEAKYAKQVADGKITQEQFDNWKKGQVFQGKQWQAKKRDIQEVLHNSNVLAAQIINSERIDVFGFNMNYASYSIEKGAGINFGFNVYDRNTVIDLIKNEPNLLPTYTPKKGLDAAWNSKKITRQITLGIMQGEKLDQIADRLARATSSQNQNSMLTHARTLMTGAQNMGRLESYKQAEKLGIDMEKEWMATLDGHTRDSHADIDGERQPIDHAFSNKCMYPGDPSGPPAEVYNCRCTMVSFTKKYPIKYQRRDNINGQRVDQMTYKDWYKAKYGKELSVKKSEPQTIIGTFQSKLGMAKTVDEVNELMNSQGWWRSDKKVLKEWGVESFEELMELDYEAYLGAMPKVDLTGCDLDSAKSIAASYEQVFEKYPTLVGQFDAPDAQPVNMRDSTYAWCYLRTNGKVQVNPKRYNNWGKITTDYENDVRSGWHPYGTTAESIVTHEIGHAIDGLLARKGILGGITSSGEYRYASSTLKNTIMNRAAKMDEEIADDLLLDKQWKGNEAVRKHVSEYATKNNQEWFAECFAEYITSANPRTIAAEFGKELEKLLGKLK